MEAYQGSPQPSADSPSRLPLRHSRDKVKGVCRGIRFIFVATQRKTSKLEVIIKCKGIGMLV